MKPRSGVKVSQHSETGGEGIKATGPRAREVAMDHATIAYGLTWVGTGAWVICFWWMRRISARQDALLMELRELAKTQHDILREVHPDVGEIKAHVVEEQGEKINEIAEQVTHVEDAVTSPEAQQRRR
jgi:hypothetical protein